MQTTQIIHNRNLRLLLAVIVFLFTACAQIVAPTGGPRDTTPPKMVKVTPLPNSLNFGQDMEIKITFDEFMEINNPNEKTMVSPPLKSAPTYKIEGKSLIIKLNDTLKENTTYTMFFDNCIKDITEGNLISSYEYVFSTGNTIDSNTIKGSVCDALTLKPEKQVYVMLYKQDLDSLPRTQKPYYITKTNDLGEFAFSHISQADFKVFTLADKNSNLIFDQFSERIGFASSPFFSKSDEPLKLSMFTQADTSQRILRSGVATRGKIFISFRKGIENLQVKMQDGSFEDRFITEISKDKDTVFLYDKYLLPDTVTLFISDQNILDTVVLSPSIERKSSRKIGAESSSKLSLSLIDGKERYKEIGVFSNYPVKTINPQRISLYRIANDTTSIPFTIIKRDSILKQFNMKFEKVEMETCLLRILDSAFIGYNNSANDTVISQFTILTENDYGSLQLSLENKKNSPLLVQLINEQGEVMDQQSCGESRKLSWKNLSPGTYQVRAVVDENRNGKWDSGNYFKKKQPERIQLLATPIQIRAKWDIEEKFVID